MHVVSSILLVIAALVVLVLGLVSVVHDLLERGPHEAPVVKSDLGRRPAYRSYRVSLTRFGGNPKWRSDRGSRGSATS